MTASKRIKAILAEVNQDELILTRTALESFREVEVAAETTSYSMVESLVHRHRPDFVFIALRPGDDQIRIPIERAHRAHPAVRVVVLGDEGDTDEVLMCFRAGADEYLPKPWRPGDMRDVLERTRIRENFAPLETGRRGNVIGVMGARGGCGTTTLSSNLAFALSREHSTVLVDFHFGQGDLALFFDAYPDHTLRDLTDSDLEIDGAIIQGTVVRHKSGLNLLLLPLGDSETPPPAERLRAAVTELRRLYDYVVLDMGSNAGLIPELCQDVSRFVLAVNQDLPSMLAGGRKLESMTALSEGGAGPAVVVNSYTPGSAVGVKQIMRMLECREAHLVRRGGNSAIMSINEGAPLLETDPRGKPSRDIERFADRLRADISGETAEAKPAAKKPFSLFRRAGGFEPQPKFA